MIIDKFILSSKQPSNTNVAWAKPFKGGYALYLYYNGSWQPQILVDDMGTASPEDDEKADISNIPEIVKRNIDVSLVVHDRDVNDTHNTATSDTDDYPDVVIY